ncbi:Inositol-1-monophosphatase SuhB (plasmid) [Actinosynnema sp. ALI-1.44]
MHYDVEELRSLAERAAVEAAAVVAGPSAGARIGREDAQALAQVVEQVVTRRLGQTVGAAGAAAAVPGGGLRWVLGPVDGDSNAGVGLPSWAVSVAAQVDGQSVAGAVAEPVSGRLWSAAAGEGARLREEAAVRTLRIEDAEGLGQALVATGFHPHRSVRLRQGQVIGRLAGEVRGLRCSGATALDLCWVAAGYLDGFYEHGVDPRSWAAGALIAQEAGAVVHWPGRPGLGAAIGDPILAARPGVAEDLVLALKLAGAEAVA